MRVLLLVSVFHPCCPSQIKFNCNHGIFRPLIFFSFPHILVLAFSSSQMPLCNNGSHKSKALPHPMTLTTSKVRKLRNMKHSKLVATTQTLMAVPYILP